MCVGVGEREREKGRLYMCVFTERGKERLCELESETKRSKESDRKMKREKDCVYVF